MVAAAMAKQLEPSPLWKASAAATTTSATAMAAARISSVASLPSLMVAASAVSPFYEAMRESRTTKLTLGNALSQTTAFEVPLGTTAALGALSPTITGLSRHAIESAGIGAKLELGGTSAVVRAMGQLSTAFATSLTRKLPPLGVASFARAMAEDASSRHRVMNLATAFDTAPLLTLQQEFVRESNLAAINARPLNFKATLASPNTALGRAHELLTRSIEVERATGALFDAMTTRGALGPSFAQLDTAATNMERVLADEPEVDNQFATVGQDLLDDAGISTENLFDYSRFLGLSNRFRGTRVSGLGTVLAVAVGGSLFVLEFASNYTVPITPLESIGPGAAAYKWGAGLGRSSRDD